LDSACSASQADLTTIKEHKGELKGLKLAFIGDGNNNVTHSLALGCAMMGMDFAVAAPVSATMSEEMSEKARAEAAKSGSTVLETQDAYEVCRIPIPPTHILLPTFLIATRLRFCLWRFYPLSFSPCTPSPSPPPHCRSSKLAMLPVLWLWFGSLPPL
jgi:hypothetical protein